MPALLPDMTIGQRIKIIKGGMTQVDLATKAGLSVSLISKLEQGIRRTVSLDTLHKLADALEVDLGVLIGKGSDPGTDPNAGVVAIRRALTSIDELVGDVDGEAADLDHARQTVLYTWGSYWAGRYDTLGALLPTALPQVRATAHAASVTEKAAANEALARILWVTGCTLVHMGAPDAAFLAIDKALDASGKADDPLLDATIRGSVAWQLLVQGRHEESVRMATAAARLVEPVGDVPPEHLSVYGSLLLQVAVASGRDGLGGQAQDHLDASGDVARRLGADRDDYETAFGPSQVIMQTVDVRIGMQDYTGALDAAATMPPNPGLPLASKARHATDRAYAAVRLGKDRDALATLLHLEEAAPDWLRYQSLPKIILTEMLDNHNRSTNMRKLLGLAERLGVRSV